MKVYSIIPAKITTNIICGTCTITDEGNIDLSFNIYQNPDTDFVYKACVCSIDHTFSPLNLGTVITQNNTCKLLNRLDADIENAVIVIYLKNTKTSETTYEGYCVLSDNPVADITATQSDTGMFDIECFFEEDEKKLIPDTDPIENAQTILDDYKELHPPSDTKLKINKKYFEKILCELEKFKPFIWTDTSFNWYKVDTFTIPGNLSSVKYVLFDTLAINAFDTHKHYLFGIKTPDEYDENFFIAIALPSKSNPINHLNDYAIKIPYNESYDYYVAYIELAPDGQYFLDEYTEI